MTDKKKKSLSDDAIKTRRSVSRRDVMLGALGATAATATAASAATDSDGGRNADPAGRGYTGRTDSDGGSNADRAGHGRRRSRTGYTDRDPGDPVGNGRGSDPVDNDPSDYVDND